MTTIDSAVRVPVSSHVSTKWVHIRGWNPMYGMGTATRSSADGDVYVATGVASGLCPMVSITVSGLKYTNVEGVSQDLDDLMAQADAILAKMGAEPCPTDEWPTYCIGEGHREDRVPFCSDAEAQEIENTKGEEAVCAYLDHLDMYSFGMNISAIRDMTV
jgi:hypothetical protein